MTPASNESVLVTGAAGFIGSHLVDALLYKRMNVIGIDNLSTGKREFLSSAKNDDKFRFYQVDLLTDDISSLLSDVDTVYHLAANPDVRSGAEDTKKHFDQNIVATYRLLESCRETGVKRFVFSSTSTVYGEANTIPTPEDYGPLMPISIYGASKLACEAMISAYSHQYNMQSVIFRFANVVGARSTHNVIHDFIHKLRENPRHLEILGTEPGTCKSYIHVSDTVEGILLGTEKSEGIIEIFNIGSHDWTFVKDIAEIITSKMEIKGAEYIWTGGTNGGGGWVGDVRKMLLSTKKLEKLGWSPKLTSSEAIELAVMEILSE